MSYVSVGSGGIGVGTSPELQLAKKGTQNKTSDFIDLYIFILFTSVFILHNETESLNIQKGHENL